MAEMLVALIDLSRFPDSGWEALPEVAAAVDAILLRGKSWGASALLRAGERVRRQAPKTPLWVAERLEVALALEAEGWHIPADGLDVGRLRRFWSRRLSAAVHTPEEAQGKAGADYWIWGHAFPTTSKPGLAPRSLSTLSHVLTRATCPVLAIGGIAPDNVGRLAGWGLSGVVVQDGIWAQPHPPDAARALARAVQRADWRQGGIHAADDQR
ncbi:MAG: thiamine phosphate synthase [Firmicutes bacterium]|nr:thiamine phosphate synthase [Alicyclobacillaceae bacterium]MCL6496192.1 thiamine phosphate synthase [Bacillota bacterium]